MKRILRSFLTLLMLVVWASGFAADKTYSYTFASKIFTSESETKSLNNIDWTLSAERMISNKVTYFGFDKNKGQQFGSGNNPVKTATFTTSGITGTIKSISVVAWNASKDSKTSLKVSVNGVSYGDETPLAGSSSNATSADAKYTFNGNSKGEIKLLFTNNGSKGGFWFNTISVTYEDGPTKTLKSLAISGDATKKAYNEGEEFDPTGLVVTGTYDDASTSAITDGITWTKTPATLAVGNTSCSVTATVNGVTSPAYKVTGLTVTKTISLSINPATSTVVKAPVTVTLTATSGATVYYTTNGDEPSTSSEKYVAPFEVTKSGTTVKAIAVAEGAENATAEATYTIKPEQPVFSEPSKTFKDAFDVILSLPESTDATSTIHYAIGATATAESKLYEGPIHISSEKDGERVILHAVVVDKYGNVGTEKYCTYTKTTAIVFDFTGDWNGVTPQRVNNNETAANVVAGKELKVGGIVMTATNGSTLTTCLYGDENGHNLRVYSGGGSITFTAPEGYNISEIVFDGKDTNNFSASEKSYTNPKWIGNEHAVTFTANKTVQLNKANIKLVAVANPTLTLDENAENTGDVLLSTESGKAYDVKLTRTLTANVWNTICLPFDVTAGQIADVLKSAGNVKEYDREDATKQTIYFKDATTMVAGKPYLIKPTESAKELVFKGVRITEYEPNKKVGGDNYAVYGTFGKYTMKTDGTELFLKTDGKFYIPAASTATMKGFRAYFYNINGSTAAAALNLSFGDATGINGVAADAEKNVKVYNVNGQYVGTSLEVLPKGLYIVGGKKVLK